MFESWSMDGADLKPAPWTPDDFFGEVRKLSGMPRKHTESIKPKGLLVSRDDSMKAEHALGSYGVEYTVEDVDRQRLRIVSQSLEQAAGILRHAKVTFAEDMPEAIPPVEEPSRAERDEMEVLHLMGQVIDSAAALSLSEQLQAQLNKCLSDMHAELKGRHAGQAG